MELQLVVSAEPDGEPQAFHFPDFERVVLGRGPDSPVPLDGPSLSREHIRFELRDDVLVVTDISSNGSWLNGRALEAGLPRDLKEGDEVGVPGYRIRPRLVAPEPEEPAAETEAVSVPEPQPAPAPSAAPPADPALHAAPPAGTSRGTPRQGLRLSALEWIVVLMIVAVLALIVVFFVY